MNEIEKCIKDNLERIEKEREMPWLKDYISVSEEFSEKQIFRIERFENFLENIKEKQLFFRHPSKWEDPYDSVFVRSKIKFPDGTTAFQSYAKDYFCQCWSTKHTERMWRQYSQSMDGIMMVSTIRRIMQKIWQNNCTRYVGKVQYFPIEAIKSPDFLEKQFGHYVDMFNPNGIAKTFLFKDDSYQYEEEVRFIVMEQGKDDRGHVMISCDLKDVIQEVVVDTRTSDEFFENVRQVGLTTRRADEWHHFSMAYEFTKK